MKNIRLPLCALSSLCFLAVVSFASLSPFLNAQTRIEPSGIGGSLLLCGSRPVSDAAIERFFDLAGGPMAKIIILAPSANGAGQNQIQRLTTHAEKKQVPPPQTIYLNQAGLGAAAFADKLREATALWLIDARGQDWTAEIKDLPLQSECRAILRRSGVVVAVGSTVAIMGKRSTDKGETTLALLPDSWIESPPNTSKSSSKARPRNLSGLVGYEIEPGATLLVKGRTLSAVGSGKILIHLGSTEKSPRELTLQGKGREDLTALLRAARDRAERFPPGKVAVPKVDKGTLVIVGGGGMPEGLLKQFVDFAGGTGKARIVIFPTAQENPLPGKEGLMASFRKAGAAKVSVLKAQTQPEVESKDFLDSLRDATGLWFDGGRQWRFVDCYEGTKAVELMFDVLKRGGVIGGSSAGATIQGEYLCRGGVFNNFDIRYEGYERGLGFLPGVAIDQHFSQRKRLPEMTALMKVYPQYLGIGLDETTAIIVQGSTASVVGKGKAHFYDARQKAPASGPDFEALSAGQRYDLQARKVLPAQEKAGHD